MLKFLTKIIKAQTQASSVELKTSPFFLSSTNAGKLLDNLIQQRDTNTACRSNNKQFSCKDKS